MGHKAPQVLNFSLEVINLLFHGHLKELELVKDLARQPPMIPPLTLGTLPLEPLTCQPTANKNL